MHIKFGIKKMGFEHSSHGNSIWGPLTSPCMISILKTDTISHLHLQPHLQLCSPLTVKLMLWVQVRDLQWGSNSKIRVLNRNYHINNKRDHDRFEVSMACILLAAKAEKSLTTIIQETSLPFSLFFLI